MNSNPIDPKGIHYDERTKTSPREVGLPDSMALLAQVANLLIVNRGEMMNEPSARERALAFTFHCVQLARGKGECVRASLKAAGQACSSSVHALVRHGYERWLPSAFCVHESS